MQYIDLRDTYIFRNNWQPLFSGELYCFCRAWSGAFFQSIRLSRYPRDVRPVSLKAIQVYHRFGYRARQA